MGEKWVTFGNSLQFLTNCMYDLIEHSFMTDAH